MGEIAGRSDDERKVSEQTCKLCIERCERQY